MKPTPVVSIEQANHSYTYITESMKWKSMITALTTALVLFPTQTYGGYISSGGGKTQIGSYGNASSIGSSFATSTTQIGSNTNLSGVIQVLYMAIQSQSQDSDADLMPDQWEIQNELNPSSNDANLDPDGDGLSNLNEYVAGTNPKNNLSKFSTAITTTGTIYRLQFQTSLGRSYEIEGSTDLKNWVSLYTLAGSGATETVPFDLSSPDLSALLGAIVTQRCFFRVIISIN